MRSRLSWCLLDSVVGPLPSIVRPGRLGDRISAGRGRAVLSLGVRNEFGLYPSSVYLQMKAYF